MKLIPSLDISEGISMDTLKPILNSGAESSYETCLGVKETPGDDNLLHPDKRPQKCLQKEKGLSDKTVESVGSNVKKMFEKVDLNSSLSSDVALKKDSWSTGTVYSKCSEKENMVENNEMRFDSLSDDESESLHLKISDDESSSDELTQSKSFDEDHSKTNKFVGSEDSKSNEQSDPGKNVLGSGDDLNCKELTASDVEDLPEHKEPSKALKSLTPVSVLGRKRTSPCSDEKIGISSKRSKVDKEDCDGPLFEISTIEHKEAKVKKAKIQNESNEQELVEKEFSRQDLDKQKVDKLQLHEQELNKEKVRNTKTIFEKKSTKLKLSTEDDKMDVSEEETSQEVKSDDKADSKSNLEDSNKKLNPLPLLRNFNRAQLKTMTRNDLEELVLQKICEAITERSMCGELRELAVNLDQKLKSWQKKSLQLTKQVKDLSLVLKRYGSDLQSKGPNATPLKITRSVGLQVQMPGSSTGICWHPDDQSWKKGEKAAAAVAVAAVEKAPVASLSSSAKSVVPNALPKSTPPPSPAAKVTPSSPVSQKVVENSRVTASTAAPQNTQSPTASIKVLPVKPPVPASPIASNKASQKTTIPSVNNRLKPSSDLQVIDLTDNEEKSKSSTSQTPTTSTSTDVTTALVPSISTGAVTRSIRVVQHLGSTNTSLLPQTVTAPVAGRVAYYVPTTTVQQRQLIISNPPVRPSGVVVSNRQNPLPAIVLNSKNIVPMTAVPASNANIIRASNISNAIQLGASRTPPRAAHFIQRLPIAATSVSTTGVLGSSVSIHPAPLPPVPISGPSNPNWKLPPPKPDLKISKVPNRNQQGIVLSWNMTISSEYEEIASYQLFAYQEAAAPPSTHLWKKVGDVKALPLPMACTLTQFMEGHKYHFAVRAVDVYARYGPFSTPGNIVLTRN